MNNTQVNKTKEDCEQNENCESFDPRSNAWVFAKHLQHVPKQHQQKITHCPIAVKQQQQQQQQM